MKSEKEKLEFLAKNWETMSSRELELHLGLSERTIRKKARQLGLPPKGSGIKQPKNYKEKIAILTEKKKKEQETKLDKKFNDFLINENERLQDELNASLQLNSVETYEIKYKPLSRDTESIAVVLASDWHCEEEVKPEVVNHRNKYNLNIAKQRAEQFFQNTLKLVEKERNATNIDTLILALLGDFITGYLRDENRENNLLQPIDASIYAEEILVSGIEYLLKNSDLKLIIPCHSGNHARTTKKIHHSTETGNSLEFFMYHHIKNHFRNEKRVQFIISPSSLSYVDVFGYVICFQHGHNINYQGGIGGLTIPANKAIAQWQKSQHADLYCFGHHHTQFDGGSFIANGSMIGWNAYAIASKCSYDVPKQTFFLINRKYKTKTVVTPILFSV